MTYDDSTVQALRTLRQVAYAAHSYAGIAEAINQLDNAGVFAALDEQTGYDSSGAHDHMFRSPHSDEVCYATEWCPVTYREHRACNTGG